MSKCSPVEYKLKHWSIYVKIVRLQATVWVPLLLIVNLAQYLNKIHSLRKKDKYYTNMSVTHCTTFRDGKNIKKISQSVKAQYCELSTIFGPTSLKYFCINISLPSGTPAPIYVTNTKIIIHTKVKLGCFLWYILSLILISKLIKLNSWF